MFNYDILFSVRTFKSLSNQVSYLYINDRGRDGWLVHTAVILMCEIFFTKGLFKDLRVFILSVLGVSIFLPL